jgi:hypothetical protein
MKFQDCNDEGLKSNGYLLRSYLTMMGYADVIDRVLQSKK